MTTTVSKAGPYYSSGAISFSSLRSNFKEATSGSISASELLRNTDTLEENPIVPDATDNSGISASSDLEISQFRNSIKYYYITQTGTNENFDIDAQSWDSNLNKNIRKWIYINGTCGSNSVSSPAATLDATAYNLTIDVSGKIYGAGGAGGTSSNGGGGGDALSVTSSGGNNIIVNVGSSGKIYGGGGGGAKGFNGDDGSAATCKKSQYFQQACQQGSFISCPGGWNQTASGQNCCEWKRGCNANNWWRWCEETISTSTPTAGDGGDGGPGRGYNNYDPEQSLSGADGGGYSCPSCPGGYTQSGGRCSTDGQDGGEGGEWGENGETKTKNLAINQGGSPGYAVRRIPLSSAVISVQGSINSDTVKGFYLI